MRLRVVEPELLDQLSPDDPRAIKCRRDLKRANTLMMHPFIMARTLRRHWSGDSPRVLVDLESSCDGISCCGRRSASHDKLRRNVPRHPARSARRRERRNPRGLCSTELDGRTDPGACAGFLQPASHRAVDTSPPTCSCITFRIRSSRACWRRPSHRRSCSPPANCSGPSSSGRSGDLQWPIGGGDVICYDGVASTRASFRGREICALWPRQSGWEAVR